MSFGLYLLASMLVQNPSFPYTSPFIFKFLVFGITVVSWILPTRLRFGQWEHLPAGFFDLATCLHQLWALPYFLAWDVVPEIQSVISLSSRGIVFRNQGLGGCWMCVLDIGVLLLLDLWSGEPGYVYTYIMSSEWYPQFFLISTHSLFISSFIHSGNNYFQKS